MNQTKSTTRRGVLGAAAGVEVAICILIVAFVGLIDIVFYARRNSSIQEFGQLAAFVGLFGFDITGRHPVMSPMAAGGAMLVGGLLGGIIGPLLGALSTTFESNGRRIVRYQASRHG